MTNQAHTFTLPSDLGAQLGRDSLATLVCQIAETCAARLAPDLPRDGSSGTASGCGLLRLLTYCYACGVLSSRAIAEMAETDPVVRSFCGDAIPERDEIAGFRRDHRALIQECMKQVCEAAWQTMVEGVGPGRVAGGNAGTQPRPSRSAHCDPDDLLRQINARISQAAQMDCWSRDW